MIQSSKLAVVRLLAVILAVISLARSGWGQDETTPLPVDNDPLIRVVEPNSDLRLVEKFAKILELKNRITTVYGFDPEVISVTKVDMHPNQIRIHALIPGVTSLVLVDEKNASFTVEIFVVGDVRHLQAYIKNLFPYDAVTAIAVRDSVVLRGYVSRPEHIPRLMDIAKEFYPNVLNQMEVGGDQEVQLKVRVIEVDRTKLRTLGFNFFGATQNAFLTGTPGALAPLSTLSTPIGATPSLGVDPTKFVTNPTVIGGVVNDNHVLSLFLEALEQESLLKVLANPILTTTNGQPANMLSGGEFPILVPQSLGTVTIQWKEFGVRLTAVPLLLGNGRVRLNLQPEVSQRDNSNSVSINGIVVPALTTRRVNTSVEMRFGETFMLAGLVEQQTDGETSKVPFLGELPWIGAAFRRVSYKSVETELVILVTPVLAGAMTECQTPPGGPGMFSDEPTARELYRDGLIEVPSYGNRCGNCGGGGYPPPIIDFDMGANRGPMLTPVPVQEIGPSGAPNGMVPMMPTPAVPNSGMPPAAPGAAPPIQLAPPPPQGPTNPVPIQSLPQQPGAPAAALPAPQASNWSNGTSADPRVRQVAAQLAPGRDPAAQALYNSVSSDASGSGGQRGQARTSGLYEPQTGLYVPASAAP